MSNVFDRLRTFFSWLMGLIHLRTRYRPLAEADRRERDLKLQHDQQMNKAWAETTSLKHQLAETQDRLKRAESEATKRARASEAQRAQISRLESERAQQQLETRALQHQLGEKTKHLEQLTRESGEAQKWMGIRDRCTDAHVVTEVEGINYEIQNIAMPLADAIVEGMQAAGLALRVAHETFSHVPLSARAVAVVAGEGLSNDALATLLGIVIQSALVSFARLATLQWDYGFSSQSPDTHAWFSTVFESIHKAEPAAISGNYKALTHRHAMSIAAHTHGAPEGVLARAISPSLLAITSGCGLSEATANQIIHDSVDEDMISGLLKAIQNLNISVKEDVISSTLIPIVAAPDAPLDAATMRIGLGDEGEALTVMATTGLGLERRERKENGAVVTSLLLAPEVATDAVLDSL